MIIYVHFILFEGIGKNCPFNSILDFALLSDFKMRTVIICEGGGGRTGRWGLLGWFPAS